jgi:hypothetical protein
MRDNNVFVALADNEEEAMSGWTAEDFKFVRERMKDIEADEAGALDTAGSISSQTSSEVSHVVSDFKAINERVKALERDGALLS